jgi:RNA polymerase sigma factor (sigma-70 family)
LAVKNLALFLALAAWFEDHYDPGTPSSDGPGRRITESLDSVDADEDRICRPRLIATWQENPEQCCSRSEIRRLVERGLLELPAKYRIVVMLRDVEHLSTEDVARQLGLSVPAVKTRLLRGRLMLREWLAPYMTIGAKGVAS